MRPAVRVGLVVLGAAMAVYGAASLTGGWLGVSPWSAPTERAEYSAKVEELAPNVWRASELSREGWVGGLVVGLGVAAVAVGIQPRRAAHRSRTLRWFCITCGLASSLYGISNLTGEWLGSPPWWTRRETRDEEYAVRYAWMFSGEIRDQRHLVYLRQIVPREHRELVSGYLVAVGLALVAVGAWPRRRAGGVC